MIFDHISNAANYICLHKQFKEIFNYLSNTDFNNLVEGKYLINGDNCFALVNRYTTKTIADSFAESHRKYIDIQFMISGTEKLGYGFIQDFENKKYDENIDLQKHDGNLDFLTLRKNHFAILFPDDVHMPGIIATEPCKILKIVVKVTI